MIKFKKLNDQATLPTRSTHGAAGFDLAFSGLPCVLPAGCHNIFETGISMEIEKGKVGIIKPRSGLAAKYGIDILAGVIDADYRGEIKVILINHGKLDFRISHGDRIAQLVVISHDINAMQVEHTTDTQRGQSGFGSTGR